MRIITGKARGKRLDTLEGTATRPTAERAKEAIFSVLQFEIEGRRVLDLFGGSGQMGLEALSRGAKSVDIVDSSDAAVKIINQNIKKVGLDGAKCTRSDFADFLRSSRDKYDIVFLDPPYALGLVPKALELLVDRDLLKPTSVVVCESAKEDVFSNNSSLEEKLEVIKRAKYGVAHVTYLKLK
jgi:16S rRNA (guanine(966)-N(2))-methyltransferase RsmD